MTRGMIVENLEQEAQLTKEAVQERVERILHDMTEDWDLESDGEISLETRLIEDLGFESIDVMQLLVSIEQEFDSREIPFIELVMIEGRYVDDLSVKQIVEFLCGRVVRG